MTTPIQPPASRTSARLDGFAQGLICYRRVIIGAWVVLLLASALGIPRLEFSASYEAYFSDQNPDLLTFRDFTHTFARNDAILFAVAPKSGDVFTPAGLAALTELTEAGWQIPNSRRVDSLINFQYARGIGDEVLIGNLVPDAAGLDEIERRRVRRIALSEPLLRGKLVSASGDVAGVIITLALADNADEQAQLSADYAKALRQSFGDRHPDMRVYLTGTVMMDQAFAEATVDDLQTLVPLVYAAIVLSIALALGSLKSTLGTVVVVGGSALAAMGIAGWLGVLLTPPTIGAESIIMTLAVADSIHILTTVSQLMRAGYNQHDAVRESLRINFQPVMITSVTTAIGFLSMNFSDAPPFRDLGNITAIGVLVAFAMSVTLLPALLMTMRIEPAAARGMGTATIERFSRFVVRARGALLLTMSGVIAVLALAIPRIELDDQFLRYFDPAVPFRAETEFAMRRLTGIYQLEYAIDSGLPHGIDDPGFLRGVDDFTQWYREQPEVVHVQSLADTVKRLNRALNNDQASAYRIPDERALTAQLLLLYGNSLPYGLDLNDRINLDRSSSRLTVTVGDLSSSEFKHLAARARAWLRVHPPGDAVGAATGPSVMFAHISERNIRTMFTGTAIALVCITAVLILALRDPRLGLISLIPNLAPAVMGFGIWALTVGKVGLVASVITAMTLGIVVDDTVHFLSKYQRARRERGLSPEQAVRYAFATVGNALVITTVVLVVGFGFLSISAFELNSVTGRLSAITIACALIADFLFLPPLLMWLDGRRQ